MTLASRLKSSGYSLFAVLAIGTYLIANGALPIPGWHKTNGISTGSTTAGGTPAADAEKAGDDLLAAAVTVVPVKIADFAERVTLTGTLVAREEILVGPEVDGLRVVEVLADEGDHVIKGQVLARLVTNTLDAQLAQNDASMARAVANISQARSNIVAAEARLVEARNAFDRGKPLAKTGVLSDAVQDQRESAAKVAEASLTAARDALRLAEADKNLVEAQRREIEWKRGRTDVAAPEAGVISRRIARVGGYASGIADPLFRIIARDEVELEAEVLDTMIARIKPGQPVTIALAGGGEANGVVRLVSPEIDKNSRLGKVRVFFGVNPALRIGGFVRGIVITARSHGLSVPSSAVLYGDTGTSVQIVRDNRVVSRPVKLGLTDGPDTEIVEGLSEGDSVVATSGTFLRNGDAVRPIVKPAKLTEAEPKP